MAAWAGCRQVTGDTTYGTIGNIVAVEDQGIRAYVPLPNFDDRTPYYGRSRFRYEPERDAYRCPQDHLLRRQPQNQRRRKLQSRI